MLLIHVLLPAEPQKSWLQGTCEHHLPHGGLRGCPSFVQRCTGSLEDGDPLPAFLQPDPVLHRLLVNFPSSRGRKVKIKVNISRPFLQMHVLLFNVFVKKREDMFSLNKIHKYLSISPYLYQLTVALPR